MKRSLERSDTPKVLSFGLLIDSSPESLYSYSPLAQLVSCALRFTAATSHLCLPMCMGDGEYCVRDSDFL